MIIRVKGTRPERSYGYRHAYNEKGERSKQGKEIVELYSVGGAPVEVPDHIGAIMVHSFEDVEQVVSEPAVEDTEGKESGNGGRPNIGENQYWCSNCDKTHMKEGSGIGTKHRKFAVA